VKQNIIVCVYIFLFCT